MVRRRILTIIRMGTVGTRMFTIIRMPGIRVHTIPRRQPTGTVRIGPTPVIIVTTITTASEVDTFWNPGCDRS